MSDRFKYKVWDTVNCEYIEDSDVIRLTQYGKFVFNNATNDTEPELNPKRFIFEQCTGLKDKNGKLIYEGYIVQTSLPYKTNNYEVKWGDGCWELWKKDRFIYTLFERMGESLENIGNIHENPDLLEQSDVAED